MDAYDASQALNFRTEFPYKYSTYTILIYGRSHKVDILNCLWDDFNTDIYIIANNPSLRSAFKAETKRHPGKITSAFIFSFMWRHSPRGIAARKANSVFRSKKYR